MAVERTLSIVKPDGVARNLIGDVYRRFEAAGLCIIGARMMHLTRGQAVDPTALLLADAHTPHQVGEAFVA